MGDQIRERALQARQLPLQAVSETDASGFVEVSDRVINSYSWKKIMSCPWGKVKMPIHLKEMAGSLFGLKHF
eukprot:5772165-Karenia_brevis.AAC.1